MKRLLLSLILSIPAFSQSFANQGFFQATLQDSKTLQLNSDCSQTTPCRIGTASEPVNFFSPSLLTIPSNNAGNDVALIYVDSKNPSTITVGTHTVPLQCDSCTTRLGVTSVPFGSKLLYAWPIVSGQFQPYNITRDFRTILELPSFQFGPGFITTTSNGTMTVSLDPSQFPKDNLISTKNNLGQSYSVLVGEKGTLTNQFMFRNDNNKQTILNSVANSQMLQAYGKTINVMVGVPSSSSSSCEVGQFATDQNYTYVCVASNKWKRSSLQDF